MLHYDKKFDIKSSTETGWFSGYASVYHHRDRQNDMVLAGAFAETLKTDQPWPKMLWQHDPAHPIGRWEKIEEHKEGLYVEGQLFLELQKSQEAFVLLKEGVVNGLSIGFEAKQSRRAKEGRVLEKIILHEISLVTFPANERARVLNIKAEDDYGDLLSRIEAIREKIYAQ